METHLKSKWGAEKECLIGPHDSFTASPSPYSSPVSPTVRRPCLPILLKPAVREFPLSTLLAAKKTPSTWCFTHFSLRVSCSSVKFHLPDSPLSVSHLQSHSLVVSNKVQKEEITKGEITDQSPSLSNYSDIKQKLHGNCSANQDRPPASAERRAVSAPSTPRPHSPSPLVEHIHMCRRENPRSWWQVFHMAESNRKLDLLRIDPWWPLQGIRNSPGAGKAKREGGRRKDEEESLIEMTLSIPNSKETKY